MSRFLAAGSTIHRSGASLTRRPGSVRNWVRTFVLVTLTTGIASVSEIADADPPSVAQAERWAVATGHPEATRVGLQVLRAGGNAVDAAVAASFALGVAEPYGSGLGGKLVLLYCDGSTGEVHCVEALCPSPKRTDVEAFVRLPSKKRKIGYLSVCVPGYTAGLGVAHRRWGSKPWGELVEPAAQLARRGVAVSAEMHSLWKPHERDLQADPEAAQFHLKAGATPAVGEKFKNEDLAETLDRIALHGADDFYRGETAKRIVEAAQAGGSPLTAEDFSSYEPRVVQPLAINYRGYRIYSSPPPLTGGVTVLGVMKGEESYPSTPNQPRDAHYVDRIARLLQVLYPPITAEIADVPESRGLADRTLSTEFIESVVETASTLDPEDPRTARLNAALEPSLDDSPTAGTTHLVVADSEGNLVSLTQSLSLHFGAAVVPPGTGVLLNDSMSNFATSWRESPNFVAGGKRPRSTVAPVIATRDGVPHLALGIPGGQRIPTTTLQLLVDVLGSGVALDEAFARPRFHVQRPLNERQPANLIDLERGAPESELSSLRSELEVAGWRTRERPANGLYFGGGNAVQRRPGGGWIAVGDGRRTNDAAGD